MTSLINLYLYIWEKEDEKEEKESTFKQSLMQAFPSMADEIWNQDENALNEDYEQIIPTSMEEFVSIENFLSNLEMNAEDLEMS